MTTLENVDLVAKSSKSTHFRVVMERCSGDILLRARMFSRVIHPGPRIAISRCAHLKKHWAVRHINAIDHEITVSAVINFLPNWLVCTKTLASSLGSNHGMDLAQS